MNVLIIAPHPDDELIGPGGTALKLAAQGHGVHWLLLTSTQGVRGFSPEFAARKEAQIAAVAQAMPFTALHRAHLPALELDTLPARRLVEAISGVMDEVRPELVFAPFHGDVHSDHRVASRCALSCCKAFRNQWTRKVLLYETISETDQLPGTCPAFAPNVFVNIDDHIEAKFDMLALYDTEMAPPPFPRSPETIKALARVRGAVAGCEFAEAFMLHREVF